MAANGLHSTTIYVGQVLLIPTSSVVTVTPQIVVYVVQPGDTLFSIARRFGTTVDAIARFNGLRSSKIFVGQQLRIPVA
jgi:LysM repeat protein